ncbi:MAG: DNA polymerase/3'-5' exonuclease PolX [Planctomycetota bacterium]|nr:MAG: DNA polymerase/3'-5' exonuclease PolX [Planctomycetota bacterium]
MDNAEIAAHLEQLADLSEIAGENPFKVRAYRAAAARIRDLPTPVQELLREGGLEALEQLPGIGERIATKIVQLLETGEIEALRKLRERVPVGLLDVLAIEGVGPKKARAFWQQLGITNVDELERAARAGKLRTLPGMGERSERKILAAIERWRAHQGRYLLPDAEADMRRVLAAIRETGDAHRLEAAGSLRRRRETIGDLDVLVSASRSDRIMEAVRALSREVLGLGETRAAVVLRSGMHCDVRVVDDRSWGSALHYFTGSKAHSVALRGLARSQGLTINEYGVFRLREDGTAGERIAGDEEPEVFLALGLDYIPPELRENRGEIEAAAAGTLPVLIERADVCGDLHVHTTWSDGRESIETMARAAIERGHRYIAITDHSARLAMTGGLDAKRLREQWREIEAAQRSVGDAIRLLRGIEVDILEDGTLDMPADALAELDVVVASVHSHFGQDLETMTARLLRAIESGRVDILGHPTGRLLLRRDPYAFDPERVFAAAKAAGVALEINASPLRLDLSDTLAKAAHEAGCALVISTDAHHPTHLDFLRYGVDVARRGWCERRHVLNTEPDPERLLARLHEGHR